MNISTEMSLAGVTLKNPVMTTSDTFGADEEYSEFMDLNKLGAAVARGVAVVPWAGDPAPHLTEMPNGMLNTIGLQNPDMNVFLEQDLPFLKRFDTRVVVNVCGHNEEEYVKVAERFREAPVNFLELDISCPNVRKNGVAFSTQAKAVKRITHRVKEGTVQPLIVKLSPNVTDITETARAAETGGANVLSLINTLTGMKIDIMWRSFALVNRTGGFSGPTVHLIAVRMVYDCTRVAEPPLIGMGGISTAADAIEMILAGATAVSVGTTDFYNPCASEEITTGTVTYLEQAGTEDIRELIGAVRRTKGKRWNSTSRNLLSL